MSFRIVAGPPAQNMSGNVIVTSTATTGAAPTVQTVLTNPVSGQFFLVGRKNLVTSTTSPIRTIAPKTSTAVGDASDVINLGTPLSSSNPRREKRRATHKEVERRRRDVINAWIGKLSEIVPGASSDGSESRNTTRSKGDILEKTYEYVTDLRQTNEILAEESEKRELTNFRLKDHIAVLEKENSRLKKLLDDHGILSSETLTPD